MSRSQDVKRALRTPAVIVPIAAAIVLILLWLVVFYSPQSSKLSKLNTQQQALQARQAQLLSELRQLQSLQSSGLSALHAQYSTLVPATIDNTGYLKLINNAVNSAGDKLLSFTPGVTSTTASNNINGVTPIPISLSTSGTYDQEIKLMQLIYQLPRLTVIDNLSISGGGASTNRSTVLSVSYAMTIYDTAPTSTAPVATTTK